ncbi:hypothetical protein VTI74DRAFT_3241 [Chaetomium olivicolor]
MAGIQIQNSEGDSHVCPICLKPFGRKDLRDRHRRRCEKSIGKARQVKKKACERCIASKVKCGYEKPSCGRCLSRSVVCEYRLEPRIRMPADPAMGLNIIATLSEPNARFTHHTADDEMQGLLPSSVADTAGLFSLTANHAPTTSHPPRAPGAGSSYLWTAHSTNNQQDDGHDYRIPTAGSDAGIGDPSTLDLALVADDPWLPDLLDSALFATRSEKEADITEFPRSLGNRHSVSVVSDMFGQVAEPRRHGRGRLSLENSDSASRASSSSPTTSDAGSSASSVSAATTTRRRSSPGARAASTCTDSSLRTPLLLTCRTKAVIHDPSSSSTGLSDLAKASPAYHVPVPPGMIGLEEVLKMTAEYPLRMLATTFRSPFLHPRLCRQSPRGMPEPIAVALACVGMKLHSEQSGLGFVCDIFRDQRDKLIKELPSLSDNHEQVCVTLHAMCIYQIEGLLSENRYTSKLATAVLHHEYLVRATQRLLRKLHTTSPSLLSDAVSSDLDWDTWAVRESLRRTIFLIVIIHQLLGITKTLDPAYFEPLLPADVSAGIALPCSDALWLAKSEGEWREARRELGSDGAEKPLKLGEALRKQGTGGCDEVLVAGGAGGGIGTGNGEAGGEWALAQLPELTRLIISMVSISVRGDLD